MSLWVCQKGHHTGPGSEQVCFICGAPTQRVEGLHPVRTEPTLKRGVVVDDADECLGCQ